MTDGTCLVDGCDRYAPSPRWVNRVTRGAQGLCRAHYIWSYKHSGALPTRTVWASAMERAVAMSRRDGDCVVFTGCINSGGYGVIGEGRKTRLVHRVAWESENGPVPAGMELDHVIARGCTSKACFNVMHLEVVTKDENMRRSWEHRQVQPRSLGGRYANE